ncbi:MAG: FG-GAP repeat domain-containing protein, partial [Phycisphaerales bacterium]
RRDSSPAERSDAGEVATSEASRRRGAPNSEGLRLLAAADFDHDGDVDLIASDDDGTRFILNRRDGDAERATTWIHRRLADSLPDATSAALGDFDDDGDLDVMLLATNAPAEVWINDLLWSWRRDARFASIEATNPVEAVWFRDDDSGGPMLAAISGDADARELAIWAIESGVVRRVEIASEAAATPGAFALSAIDLAGSGRTNLLLSRPLGDGSVAFEIRDARGNLVESVGPLPAIASLAVPDARGAVMLVGETDGTPRWRDAGPGRMGFAAIWFSGRTDPSQQMRTNESGLGTRGDARTVGAWQSRTALPWRGGAGGQPLEPVLFGLAGAPSLEWLSIDWPDGVLQSELELGPGIHRVVETQRQISSCPVIFAWNGTRFEFVTDTLGVGGMGYLAAIEETPDGTLVPIYPTPRPLESVLLGGDGVIAPRNGRFEIRLGEPMEEACYLDSARLVAWDLPAGWSMTLDERMGISGPAPTGQPRFFRRAMTPSAATMTHGDRALDATEELALADFVAADPGEADPRFIGRTAAAWTLTFSFPHAIASGEGDPALVVDGWVEYPYSSTSFAMWQAGATPEAPTLEALDPATNEWITLVEQYGYPAGMPRQASFPIDRAMLPQDCTTLRLRSTNEVYLDRVQLAWFEPCPDAERREMPLAEASVADTGFAHRPHLPQRRPSYDYDRRAPLWDVQFQFGFYTAFGPCTELLATTDDAVAIFGAGEEVRLEFADRAPPLPADRTRAWVLELEGWCKDMDPFTGLGATLEPLPLRAGSESTPRREELHRRFNTRFAGGR